MVSESEERDRLPFEPRQKKKKTPKKAPTAPQATASNSTNKSQSDAELKGSVPEVVSKRMIRRMALFCGIPTALGISSFVVSYFIVSKDWFELPTAAVMLVSMGFFGLGVIGLSYGIFSASWEEERVGSWLGFAEFKTNFGRTVAAWRNQRQEAKGD
ncbi:MAG: PAM68 family protein [Oscillatoria sp. PMC 1068.18]|nr:PAM68 family protein [Oscillatoria sp. PMC 1076.18]MEC4990878.1 PAM68 family protein [Oscillatoria sp. PMC 1068.18]